MNNNHLSVIGSSSFLNLLNELELDTIVKTHSQSQQDNKKLLIKILFVDNLKIKDVKNHLLQNEPIILFLKQKDYLKKNNLHLQTFHVSLELPIQILVFKEILNILITKYNFFKKSEIIIKDYKIDSNERSISKNAIKVKLTEKELELILELNNCNGLSKSFLLKSIWKHTLNLDTHAFETHLYRLRKKIYRYFKDRDFIIEKNSLYYLST